MFRRGTISPKLYEECMKLKQEIIKKGIVKNPQILTLPKLQEIILEKQKRRTYILPEADIRRILLG